LRIYEASFLRKIIITGNFKENIDPDPQVNRYDRLNYKYNYFNPGVTVEYNTDDGVFVGLQARYVKQGFRKEPYSMQHFIMGSRAFATDPFIFVTMLTLSKYSAIQIY
jgi:hypothetical protein